MMWKLETFYLYLNGLISSKMTNYLLWIFCRSRPTTPRSPLNQRRDMSRQNSFQNIPGGYWKGSQGSNLDYDDYSDFQMCRDYPYNELSRNDSIGGFMSESNYSAITPEVSRKLNLKFPEPKKDFGFITSPAVSQKKEPVPKPPRRNRSQEGASRSSSRMSNMSRPGSRMSESRESTPTNQQKHAVQVKIESPSRPRRFRYETKKNHL